MVVFTYIFAHFGNHFYIDKTLGGYKNDVQQS